MFLRERGTVDPQRFRATMGRFATGVTIVSTAIGGQAHGMTANAFMSVSLDPALVLVSIGHRARMHELLRQTGRYGVSMLAENQEAWSQHFGGRPHADLPIRWRWELGMPLLEEAAAHVIAQVVDAYPAGDHTLFIAEVQALDYRPERPLLFHAGSYAQLAAA